MGSSGEHPEDVGHSDCMGPKLRELVEARLRDDLNQYVRSKDLLNRQDIHFDWSGSCVEGHRTQWLDGDIENFSGIAVYDGQKNLVAEGWMEFIETETGLEIFWWFLKGGTAYRIEDKVANDLPIHVWEKLSDSVQTEWRSYAPKEQAQYD